MLTNMSMPQGSAIGRNWRLCITALKPEKIVLSNPKASERPQKGTKEKNQ